jgi:hypothetical protein
VLIQKTESPSVVDLGVVCMPFEQKHERAGDRPQDDRRDG